MEMRNGASTTYEARTSAPFLIERTGPGFNYLRGTEMTNSETITARNIKYDLCDRCTMPRTDRHHSATYKMERTAYDIPRHSFVDAKGA